MPDSAANSNAPSDPSQTPAAPQFPAPPTNHHASAIAEAGALPPTLTPATTTRQSVALGLGPTVWASNITPTLNAQPILSDSSVPAILTHAPSLDAQGGPSDLTASAGSVPSTTTTLTNTLPPTQSAALRALNAPAFHSSPAKSKSAKSTSSRTTVTSQPVVVRTYSASRHASRPGSGFNTPRSFAMNGHSNASALSAGLAGKSEQLPSADDFSFSAILRAVDPEIRDAIDAIAEICARSRMSLADEYDAHLPPQGEITGAGPGWAASTGALVGRGRLSKVSQGWTAADNTLMAVPEASSSSERLAQEGKIGSSKRRSQSAYGSLKSVISGGSGKRKALDGDTFRDQEGSNSKQVEAHKQQGPAWTVHASSSTHPSITLVTSPTASKQLSLETSTALPDVPEEAGEGSSTRPQTALPQRAYGHRRGISTMSLPASRTRSGTLSSIASWLPWPRPTDLNPDRQQELTKAEARLREMLSSSESLGKGKSPVTVA
ncbi:Nn.00g082830.m01.CDS01 [Neocucurbitaria sp. VM-36]